MEVDEVYRGMAEKCASKPMSDETLLGGGWELI